MDNIGTYVLNAAYAFAASWKSWPGAENLKIALNISPQQFGNESFCLTVLETLKRHQLAPEQLDLEITEEILVYDFHEVSDLLEKLRSMGVRVEIDDFGSGLTSLRYLTVSRWLRVV